MMSYDLYTGVNKWRHLPILLLMLFALSRWRRFSMAP